MPTPGFLPTTRPLASSYGEDLENEKPVRNPQLEASADNYNDVRHDVAFLGQVSALARIRVQNYDSSGSLLRAYGVDPGYVTVTAVSPGVVSLVFSPSAGINFLDASVSVYRDHTVGVVCANVNIVDAVTLAVHTQTMAGADIDVDFIVSVF